MQHVMQIGSRSLATPSPLELLVNSHWRGIDCPSAVRTILLSSCVVFHARVIFGIYLHDIDVVVPWHFLNGTCKGLKTLFKSTNCLVLVIELTLATGEHHLELPRFPQL